LDRLEILVGFSEMRTNPETIRRFIANSIDVLVHVRRSHGGKRRVTSIAELTSSEGSNYSLNELFRFVSDPRSEAGGVFERATVAPHFADRLTPAQVALA
jgi:pilus assembly protein CpaF